MLPGNMEGNLGSLEPCKIRNKRTITTSRKKQTAFGKILQKGARKKGPSTWDFQSYHYIIISLYRYIIISLYRCIIISLYHYIIYLVKLLCVIYASKKDIECSSDMMRWCHLSHLPPRKPKVATCWWLKSWSDWIGSWFMFIPPLGILYISRWY